MIQLPTHARSYGSTKELTEDLHNFFAQHPGLPSESISILVHFALSTWFPECSAVLPSLSVVAPDASGSTLLLRLLRCVCRHSLHVIEITEGGIFMLPFAFRPTLLIDQAKPTGGLQRILCAMSRPGVVFLRNGQYRDISCSIVVCSEVPLTDPGHSNFIHVVLMPTRGRLPKIHRESLTDVADELQGQLLQYRLANFKKVQTSKFDAPELNTPAAEMARTLGTCVVDHDELQSRIIELLEPQDESRVRHSTMITAIVIEAAFFFCHEKNRQQAYVAEFAAVCNAILRARKEVLELEPRAVGDVLRAIGLFTQRLGGSGRGVLLVNDVRRKIHCLAREYDIQWTEGKIDRCKFCAESGMVVVRK